VSAHHGPSTASPPLHARAAWLGAVGRRPTERQRFRQRFPFPAWCPGRRDCFPLSVPLLFANFSSSIHCRSTLSLLTDSLHRPFPTADRSIHHPSSGRRFPLTRTKESRLAASLGHRGTLSIGLRDSARQISDPSNPSLGSSAFPATSHPSPQVGSPRSRPLSLVLPLSHISPADHPINRQ